MACRNSSVEIWSEQRDQRSDTHSDGEIQNAGEIPGHEASACRKARPPQETGQHEGSSDADCHIAQPGRPGEDSWQDFVGV